MDMGAGTLKRCRSRLYVQELQEPSARLLEEPARTVIPAAGLSPDHAFHGRSGRCEESMLSSAPMACSWRETLRTDASTAPGLSRGKMEDFEYFTSGLRGKTAKL